jgi:hypothetical protein
MSAADRKLKRQVAVKILPLSLAADADRLARFQREAECLSFRCCFDGRMHRDPRSAAGWDANIRATHRSKSGLDVYFTL